MSDVRDALMVEVEQLESERKALVAKLPPINVMIREKTEAVERVDAVLEKLDE